jgi:arylsulfatase A-like enzyme
VGSLKNIVVVLVDTLRPTGLSDGNTVHPPMPFLQSVQRSGATVDRFLASSSWTLPSHQALLCGDDPWSDPLELIGTRSERIRASLARAWHAAGGNSIAISQNPIVNVDGGILQGFDYGHPYNRMAGQRLMLEAANQLDKWITTSRSGEDCRHDVGRDAPSRPGLWGEFVRRAASPFAAGLSGATVRLRSTGRSLVRLDRYMGKVDRTKPLLLFLNVMEAHEPYSVSGPGPNPTSSPTPAPTNSIAAYSGSIAADASLRHDVTEGYANGLRSADRALENIFAFLSRRLDMQRTLVLVVSDHGQALGEHGYYGHGSHLYDELVHVPCVFWGRQDGLRAVADAFGQDWVDHLHLYDLLTKIIGSGLELPTRQQVEELVRARGAAQSYVTSRIGRRSDGPCSDGEVSLLRLESGDSYAVAEFRNAKSEVIASTGPRGMILGGRATSNLTQIRQVHDRRIGLSTRSVESRLASWGYL